MDEKRYRFWWLLHRRVVMGEELQAAEQRDYQAGRAELEAEEWRDLRVPLTELRSAQARLRDLTLRNQQLTEEESALRRQASELEERYAALTGEELGLGV